MPKRFSGSAGENITLKPSNSDGDGIGNAGGAADGGGDSGCENDREVFWGDEVDIQLSTLCFYSKRKYGQWQARCIQRASAKAAGGLPP